MSTGPEPEPPRDTTPVPAAPGGLLDALRVTIILLDTYGRVLLWSPMAEEMLGWAGDHVVGRRFDRMIAAWPDDGGGGGSGDDGGGGGGGGAERKAAEPGEAGVLVSLLRAGRWAGTLVLRHRDGHTVPVEVRAWALVDGEGRRFVLASLVESRLLHAIEHDLALLDAVFHTSPLGIAVYGTDLRLLRINDTLCAMDSLTPENCLGRTVTERLSEELGEKHATVQRSVLDTGHHVIDLHTPGPGGIGMRSVSYSRITDGGDRVLGVCAIVMDITDRYLASMKAERARDRLTLLNDVGATLTGRLDTERMAQALAEALVPSFCDDAGVLLLPAVASGADLPRPPHGPCEPLVLTGVATRPEHGEIAALLRPGMPVSLPESSPLTGVLTGGPPWYAETPADLRGGLPEERLDPRIRRALALGIGSAIAVPLRARGTVLGLLIVARALPREGFDPDDLALATELADRAGGALDSARMYVREREAALMLQRSLLPQRVPVLPGIEIAHRYVPGGTGAEAGGDWFDVIPLAGGRVAFVIGDVMGHGLRPAATMGRMRTAVRALAALDLPPEELLRRVNSQADDFAAMPDEPMMATVVYVVYEPSTRSCSMARAGHLPPLLVTPGGAEGGCAVRCVDIPAGTPIGVGGQEFESVEFEVPDGAVLVLYTDGLIERRGEDITVGLGKLVEAMRQRHASLEDACDHVLNAVAPAHEPDDIAVLMARLGSLPEGSAVSWEFAAGVTAARRATEAVHQTLARWKLDALCEVTVLLVGELVTNSLRHARGPIAVRMVRGSSLLVEVSDPFAVPPRARLATAADDEDGQGMRLVARFARRWGTRQGPIGRTVWFELRLPR